MCAVIEMLSAASTRLALEARESIGIGRECPRQDLDGDVAAESRVARPIDFAHPAGTKRGDDLVDAQATADDCGGLRIARHGSANWHRRS